MRRQLIAFRSNVCRCRTDRLQKVNGSRLSLSLRASRVPNDANVYVRLPGVPYDQPATRYSVLVASRDQTTQRPTLSLVRTLFQDAAATMAPARNTRLQAAKKGNRAAFFKLPAELRNE